MLLATGRCRWLWARHTACARNSGQERTSIPCLPSFWVETGGDDAISSLHSERTSSAAAAEGGGHHSLLTEAAIEHAVLRVASQREVNAVSAGRDEFSIKRGDPSLLTRTVPGLESCAGRCSPWTTTLCRR